ncbi:MAG: DUF1080 domain-containing protein [Gemmatales bacterium]
MLSFLMLIFCQPVGEVAQETRRIVFLSEDAGKLPSTWERAHTGEGEGSVWKVVTDKTTPSGSGAALAQTAAGPNQLYNLATLKDSQFLNGTIAVRLKAIEGKLDQGGGIVWRYQDANNYYLARFNPLEDNFRVYHVVNGKRTQLGTEEKLTFPNIQWHTLSITHDGNMITCTLNGKQYLKVEDKTISKPGRVGLWTKADAQTRFDALEIQGTGDNK